MAEKRMSGTPSQPVEGHRSTQADSSEIPKQLGEPTRVFAPDKRQTRKYAADSAVHILERIHYFGRKAPLAPEELDYVGEILSQVTRTDLAFWSRANALRQKEPESPTADKSAPVYIHSGAGRAYAVLRFKEGGQVKISAEKFRITPKDRYFVDGNIIKVHDIYYSVNFDRASIVAVPIDNTSLRRPLGRPPRPLESLPRPDLPASAEENRTKQLFRARIEPSLVQLVNRAAKERGQTVSDWASDAFKAHLKRPKPTDP